MTPQNIFDSKLEVELNTLVFSDPIVFDSAGSLKSISNNVFIYKNETLETSPVAFVSADSIKVAVQSSSEYADQVFGILELNAGTKSTHIFTCVTKSNLRYVPEFKDLEPFELTTYADGSNYVPDGRGNKVLLYDNFVEQHTAIISGLDAEKSVQSFVNETDSIVFCSFFDGKVYRINAVTNEISGIIKVPGKCYGAVAIPKIPSVNFISDLWVTISDKDKVVVLDNSDQIIREFDVGARPLGIATNGDYNDVWVANSYDDTVTHLKWNSDTLDWDISTISVGFKPFEIACDTNGNAWITCAADDKVYRVTSDEQVTSYVVGKNPRGIAYNSNKIWVAISQEEKVIALDLQGNLVHTLNDIGLLPFSIGAMPLPMTIKTNISDLINITDNISANRITDAFTLVDSILADKGILTDNITFAEQISRDAISDTLTFSEQISLNAISDTLIFTESLNVTRTAGIPEEIIDPTFNYVSLLLNGDYNEYADPTVETRYLIVEVQDFYSGVGGSINELIITDEDGNQLTFTVTANGAYDFTTNDVPEYWNDHL